MLRSLVASLPGFSLAMSSMITQKLKTWSVLKNLPIILANLLQRSRSTFSRGSFLSFFAFKEGMWDTPISTLGGWPTVVHEPGLSTAYENSGLFSGESLMSLALTTRYACSERDGRHRPSG